ncbi:hypothetical protein DDW10_00200 [Sulfolobales archaeon SCGC AB-777_J03]|nr:hypothetical protein DDW10_00200 [Sulfolobales archaeon SCGC AB-777_J03]
MSKSFAYDGNITDDYFDIAIRLDITQSELKKLLNLTFITKIDLFKSENIDIVKEELKRRFQCDKLDIRNYDDSRLIIYCKYSTKNLTNLSLIKDALKIDINFYGKKLLTRISPKNFEKLKSLAAKIHRIHLLDWNEKGNVGFFITKLLSSSSRYVNFIVTIPDIPILSILRMKRDSNKLVHTEKKDFIVSKISVAEWGERKSLYLLNNYIIPKVKPTENEFQRIIFSTDLINSALISSLRGITNEDGILIPWPFSSFQLATNNYRIYTIFIANVKIKDVKEQYTDKLFPIIFDEEIYKVNYKYYEKLLWMKAKVNLIDLYNTPKTIEKEINLVTTEDMNKIIKFDKNKTYLGVIMGKSFTSIFDNPLFLVHVLDERRDKQILEFIKKFDELAMEQKVIRSALEFDSVRSIKKIIYDMAYSESRQHLLSLSGVDELLNLQLIGIKIYKLVHEILYGKELKIRYLLSTSF